MAGDRSAGQWDEKDAGCAMEEMSKLSREKGERLYLPQDGQ